MNPDSLEQSIQSVAVIGGTHGNETTGVHLVNHWQSQPEELERSSFSTELYLANPRASKAGRRYLEQDLNRQFDIQDLDNPSLEGYEEKLAKTLNEQLGPKESPCIDFIIDMHTTTANMGMTLIFNACDPLLVGSALYIKRKMPEATLFYDPSPRLQDACLTSLGRLNGLLIEVGPIAQGLLKYQVTQDMRKAVKHALDYIELCNQGLAPELPDIQIGFEYTQKISLPKNKAGDINALVHPELQDKDYQVIRPGDPLFKTMNGETIAYEGEEPVYGAFINEAAYYDQKVGLSFMKKINIVCESGVYRIEDAKTD